MYVSINKEWFEKNKVKFAAAADDKDSYVLDSDSFNEEEVEVSEITDEDVFLTQSDTNSKIYISLSWKPTADHIAELLERSMEDLKGESLTRVIEVVVKKLNKLRSFIESIKGL